jgi:hypothetical protein
METNEEIEGLYMSPWCTSWRLPCFSLCIVLGFTPMTN